MGARHCGEKGGPGSSPGCGTWTADSYLVAYRLQLRVVLVQSLSWSSHSLES